mgnify:CR=1 FL=1
MNIKGWCLEKMFMKKTSYTNRKIGGVYTKEKYERLFSQNEFVKDSTIGFDSWDYLPLISVVVSAFSLVLSVVVWLFKVL